MKKSVVILLFLPFLGLAQSAELEKLSLQKRYEAGLIDQETYVNYAKEWKKLLDEFGGYPDFPVNSSTDEIEFLYIQKYPDLGKKEIFSRILEWGAINFGSLNSVLNYKNFEDGKIILKGYHDIYHEFDYNSFFFTKKSITKKVCYQTFVFTVKDNALKIEISNLTYHVVNLTLSSQEKGGLGLEFSIDEVYPVTKSEPKFWNENLGMLLQTKLKLASLVNNIEYYVLKRKTDYQF